MTLAVENLRTLAYEDEIGRAALMGCLIFTSFSGCPSGAEGEDRLIEAAELVIDLGFETQSGLEAITPPCRHCVLLTNS